MARGCAQAEAFFDQFANHLQKLGMHPNRGGAHHVDAAFTGDVLGFGVQIVDHFHVIGYKTDRHDNYVGAAIHFAHHVANVGLEPGLARAPHCGFDRPGASRRHRQPPPPDGTIPVSCFR